MNTLQKAQAFLNSEQTFQDAQKFLESISTESIKIGLQRHELNKAARRRDLAKMARGQKYGPWERFQGNPDNSKIGEAVYRAVQCAA